MRTSGEKNSATRKSSAVTTLASPVRGLHAVGYGSGEQIFVAERRAIVRLDGANGQQMSSFAADTPRLTGLGFQVPPPSGSSYSCAC